MSIVLNDACHANFAGDTDRGLVILDLLNQRLAADRGVAGLVFTEVVRRLVCVHLGDLPLQELLILAYLPLHLFLLLSLSPRLTILVVTVLLL